MQIPSKGGFPANRWNIRKNFYSYPYNFFLVNSPTGQTLRRIFARDGLNDAVSRKDVPLGVKNLKLIFNVFICKNRKNYNGAYGEN